MTEIARPRSSPEALWPAFVLILGAVVLVVVLSHPAADGHWENHPAHFWLVLGAAALAVTLGYAVGVAARRRRDARLLLVSLAFISAAGFLGLHALATPGVLIGKNAGFELATPVGLVLAGVFAAASSLPLRPEDRRAHPQPVVAADHRALGGDGRLGGRLARGDRTACRASSAPRS